SLSRSVLSTSKRKTTGSMSAPFQQSGCLGIDEPPEATVVRNHALCRERVRLNGAVEDSMEHRRLVGAAHEEDDLGGGVQHDRRERDAPHRDRGGGSGHDPALRLAPRMPPREEGGGVPGGS